MKHALLISAMSFVLVAGTGPSFAINPGPAALGLGSGAINEMAGQRLAQMQPGQGQPSGEQGQATPGSKKKMGQQGQGEKMGQEGEREQGQPGTRKKAEGQSGQQGGKMGTQTEEQKKATESEQPSGQRKKGASGEPEQPGTRMGTSGEQSGSRVGEGGKKQPGVKGSVTERSETATPGGSGGGVKGSASLTVQDRTKITTVFKEAKVQPLENVTFSLSVGTRVPREVHLYTLPTEVVEIHPAWRHFEYILVRGEIIIINPSTFEIVAVLPLA